MPRRAASSLPFADLQPMLLSERKTPWSDPHWQAQLKFDGYRVVARLSGGCVTLTTKNGADCTSWFPELVDGLRHVRSGVHVLDGEAVVLDSLGRSDFNRLHARARRRRWVPGCDAVAFAVFDVPAADGKDICQWPLERRQDRLQQLLEGVPGTLFVQGLCGQGEALYRQACALGLEGIVLKKVGSCYHPGTRSHDWIKVKCPGATPPRRFNRAEKPAIGAVDAS